MAGARANDPFSWLMQGHGTAEEEAAVREAQDLNADAAREVQEKARLFADVFLHGRGPELLQELRNSTIEVPLMNVSRSFVSGEVALSPADWAYVREGQNSVIRLIEEQIRIAITPAPAAPERQNEGPST